MDRVDSLPSACVIDIGKKYLDGIELGCVRGVGDKVDDENGHNADPDEEGSEEEQLWSRTG